MAMLMAMSTLSTAVARGFGATRSVLVPQPWQPAIRWFRSTGNVQGPEEEERMKNKLLQELEATSVVVEDQSGGCGAQYLVEVISSKFEGLNTIKQHRLVSSILKDEIADMHAIRIFTSTPQQ
eukprot:m.486135 g.486135  ORF g.486135 m.486135 type:complete len:123 (+) comp24187_c0_seq1:124-492(+)